MIVLTISIAGSVAQEPPHPPTTGHGHVGNQSPGTSARLGDGVSILVAFALAYGYRRINVKKKSIAIQEEDTIE